VAAAVLRPGTANPSVETHRAQGLVASAYGHMPHSAYLLLGVTERSAARAWLGSIVGDVTTAAGKQVDRPCVNLALTHAGLGALGLGDEALASFPRALQEGMVTGHRSRILGDVGANAPERWRWGGPGQPDVHVMLMLFARDEDELAGECKRRRTELAAAGGLEEVGEALHGRVLPGGREHFGFADGISQPAMQGCGSQVSGEAARWSVVAPGEFVLGYPDNYGRPAGGPTVAAGTDRGQRLPAAVERRRRDLGRNGSYLVFRQLAQDVPAFHRFLEGATRTPGRAADPAGAARLAAEMVGRWPSGTSLVHAPEGDDLDPARDGNAFGYHDLDQDGLRCPLGAHVRRANPRDSSKKNPEQALRSANNHRLLRRGRHYGLPIADPPSRPEEEEGADRGLLFVCLNGDIERQFEFVQHTWLNNPNFAGLNGEVDPVVGDPERSGGRFTEQREPVRRRIGGLSRFVTTRGGGYFFLPGVPALEYLAALD
jgi:Dyp-type peroxidase family